ncbi:MAG TPA: 2-amino-4-hydroxy-6-hydroxymethyldihydropteridine diphosphokinase [Bacillota bacterium]|nr:2-amino-4-hydroxy-6-hydroxymethyldihydropteridine diphosphokinase [Bacillota bacterium]
MPLNSVFLGIGTNLGDKKKNIELAFDKIEEQIGNITSISALYLSKPQGFDSENLFVNCAIHIQTPLKPTEVLSETQSIEKDMGRKDKSEDIGYADRIIDIDILFYNNLIINNSSTLIIPHPHIQERDFVLKPLSEIAPDLIHPVFNKSIEELLNNIL